ncbi:MAG: hypothetical protein KC422_23420, partial [Trueperaceae bacterium]|nr:hypothetical protein [Trueperaceae bacterium]
SGYSKIMLNHEDISFLKTFDWTHETSELFVSYYRANNLLVDCLNLAVVSNKDAIIDQLFLPASESQP